jgi:putative thioredoxin
MQPQNPRITPASLAGAVDLSSLRPKTPPPTAPAPAAGPAGTGRAASTGAPGENGQPPAPNGTQSQYVIDVTEANFQTEVLERSLQTPVVIDFWAEWCGPCKQLSPVLEKLANESGGDFILAKVDVDANQRLAAAFRVQSIPMVVAVVGGQPIDAFAGALPESQLRPWLAAVVQAASGGQEGAEVAIDPRLLEADEKLQAGDFDAAEAGYRTLLAENPNDPLATSGLAQLELFRRLENVDPAAALAAGDAAPDDVDAQNLAADVEFASGEADKAFDRLVGTVRRTSGDDRDAARTHLLDLFAIAAPDDPVVAKARRDLTAALF